MRQLREPEAILHDAREHGMHAMLGYNEWHQRHNAATRRHAKIATREWVEKVDYAPLDVALKALADAEDRIARSPGPKNPFTRIVANRFRKLAPVGV